MNKTLFSAAQIGPLHLNNRIVMAPLTRSRAANPAHAPTDIHATYYAQRATAGLIISEATVVSPQGVGYVNVPGIYSDEQVAGWKQVTDAVHAAGGKIVVQLWHVGRVSHPDFHKGELPVAPSAINPNRHATTPKGRFKTVTPRALSIPEIKGIVQDFRKAGENAMKAGFDGVEVHASNGYLFHQFFSDCSNHRTDEYGGSHENKSRFLFEVLDALQEVMPANRIGVRLNPMMHNSSGITIDEHTTETFNYIVRRLNAYNLAFLHLTRPGHILDEPWFIRDLIGHFRKIYTGFLIANGKYDGKSGEEEVASQRADAIAYGWDYIANPDLVARLQHNWPLAKADPSTFYTPGPKGYSDYPAYQ